MASAQVMEMALAPSAVSGSEVANVPSTTGTTALPTRTLDAAARPVSIT